MSISILAQAFHLEGLKGSLRWLLGPSAMVSTLTDKAKALQKAQAVHSFLSDELQLPVGSCAASVNTFAAFMGVMRSCNPLHCRSAARKALHSGRGLWHIAALHWCTCAAVLSSSAK